MLVKLKEDLLMCNDNYGFHSGGGTAEAGTIFKVLATPSPKKKKYKLEPQDVKFPYYLYLRENDFKRLFIEI
jgi:hypothetical protein